MCLKDVQIIAFKHLGFNVANVHSAKTINSSLRVSNLYKYTICVQKKINKLFFMYYTYYINIKKNRKDRKLYYYIYKSD